MSVRLSLEATVGRRFLIASSKTEQRSEGEIMMSKLAERVPAIALTMNLAILDATSTGESVVG